MTYRVAEAICRTDASIAELPEDLARGWPDAPALELVLAMALAAQGVEGFLGDNGKSGQHAQQVWKQAALIAAQVHHLSVLGLPNATARDLLDYWTEDGGRG